ncbi:glycosyltransferase 1 domain-containing protein 1 [Paramormyrops kingsleyae]|uniref:Glycosyltransferase 1 domain containing 1 n=1 Tax=Paramormyrops kingsleyae TaxID=1676925 RepID=A0A3B3QJ98_9TELE|nr:glycosyltransferase 1 domain-containing protein 1 isoform X1 [Paramormyrops kingsleyae]
MKLLFLACLSPQTGNCTTAERIRGHIESAGHTCVLRDVADFKSPGDVEALMKREPPCEGVLAIHLYKGGQFLLGCQAPFGVIFGGTDLNEDVKDNKKLAVMEQVLKKARFAVAFSHKLKEVAELLWPTQSSRVHVHPQGVETRVAMGFNWDDFLRSAGVSAIAEDLRVFLLVCGLRRVKDPLYLLEAFSEWHAQDQSVILIIIGPKVDPVFAGEVEESLRRSTGVFLAEERSQEELHAALRRSFALVNSSVSEGMSAAILEAMDLEVPVVARDVPGNAAIVRHEGTGLLYSTPQEFVALSQRLLGDRRLAEHMVRNAKRYVSEYHSSLAERTAYQRLVELLH